MSPQSRPPDLVTIDHDDYHASRIGHTGNGRQFFVTTPFVPALASQAGREFLAVYIFDENGDLLDARIDDLGPRSTLNRTEARQLLDRRMEELAPLEYGRIQIKPFAVERFGITFGLVLRSPEEPGDSWWVEVQPGNYMAFHEPWDSGIYDT
jgi:hypothetical protein